MSVDDNTEDSTILLYHHKLFADTYNFFIPHMIKVLPADLYNNPAHAAAVNVLNSSSDPLANCRPTPVKLYNKATNKQYNLSTQ